MHIEWLVILSNEETTTLRTPLHCLILNWSQALESEEVMSAGSCQLSSPSGAMNTVRMNEP